MNLCRIGNKARRLRTLPDEGQSSFSQGEMMNSQSVLLCWLHDLSAHTALGVTGQ